MKPRKGKTCKALRRDLPHVLQIKAYPLVPVRYGAGDRDCVNRSGRSFPPVAGVVGPCGEPVARSRGWGERVGFASWASVVGLAAFSGRAG